MAKLNAQDLGRWRHRILATEEYQAKKLKASDEAVRMFQEPDHWTDEWIGRYGFSGRLAATANLVWGNMAVLLPAIYAGVPRPVVNARSEEYSKAAENQEKYFRWLLSQIDWVRRRRRVIRTAMLRGWCAMKVVYKETRTTSNSEPRSGEEAMPPGHAYAFRLSPFEFLCDPDAGYDLTKARWVAHKIRRTPEELKKDKEYKNADAIEGGEVDPYFREYLKTAAGITEEDVPDLQKTSIYEVWVRDYAGMERQVFTFSPRVDEPLIAPSGWKYQELETYPFDVLAFHDSEESEDGWHEPPIPETRAWVQPNMHVSFLLSKLLAGVETYDRIVALDASKLSSTQEKEKIVIGGDMTLVNVNTADPRTVAFPLQFGLQPPELWGALDRMLVLYDRVTGVSELMRGVAPTTTSATMGAIAQSNMNLRPKDLREKIAESDQRVLRIMKQISQEFLPEEFLVQVTGPGGLEWVHMKGDDIRAELDVTIDVDSINPETLEARKQRNLQALQLVGPILNSPNGIPSGLRELVRRNLKDIGFDDAELFLPPASGQTAEEEHVRWLLDETPIPEVRPEDDDAGHLAKHTAFRNKYERHLGAKVFQMETGTFSALDIVDQHIARHEDQMAVKRSMGGTSVRGSLKPMAPTEGTPGALTGSPAAAGSLFAPPGMGA